MGTSRYGLPLEVTREVLRATSIASLPRAPEIIEGIIDIRGALVPVLDIRSRFRAARKPLHPSDQFVIADAGQRTVALRVDQVTGIEAIEAEAIDDAKAVVPQVEYVAGVARLADGLVLLHDLGTFLSAAEAEQVDDALEEAAA